MITLDHIVVSGLSLCEASDYVESSLGVRMQDGGAHERFATHNRLLGLAGGIYLEAIAVDPKKKKPPYPRWFNLDNFRGEPRITNWVCRSKNIKNALESKIFNKYEIVKMKRNHLYWLMALPRSGNLPFDGSYPALLEWRTKSPSAILIPSGCKLKHMTIFHPEYTKLKRKMNNFNDPRISFEYNGKARFHAEFNTPHGLRFIE